MFFLCFGIFSKRFFMMHDIEGVVGQDRLLEEEEEKMRLMNDLVPSLQVVTESTGEDHTTVDIEIASDIQRAQDLSVESLSRGRSRSSSSVSTASTASSRSSRSPDSTRLRRHRHTRSRSRSHSPRRHSRTKDHSRHRSRERERDRDKKHRDKKKKDKHRSEKHSEERRSVLTGKKIKLKVHKSAADLERDANREHLLQFLNSACG
ncbi:hypothetical protein NM688_g2647 [Phlebia brevispora]|uniref:Uncharacterized protein n=1 Tax=Phlebia brevispora TaxID=194682 RepID=A0ACC1T873_9APHY|nr:hypothetical protein NM688_g2647 [Phlebia brevispora]